MNYSRQAALVITTKKKIECNKKAMRIVETMVENNVEPVWLVENVKYITDSHFQDVIEERAISKQCGYPICNKHLGHVPSQQFRISTKTNKVYDITERKHFCSNICYKASQFLKGQLLTSPVWLRDNETIPSFQLISLDSPGGHIGSEVDINCVQKAPEYSETSSENEKSPVLPTVDISNIQPSTSKEDVKTEIKTRNDTGVVVSICENSAYNSPNDTSSCEVNSPPENKNDMKQKISQGNLSNSKPKTSKKKDQMIDNFNFVWRIEKCFSEWFSLDSFIYIHGIEKAKELLKDKVECLKAIHQFQSIGMESEMEKKYKKLGQKISLLEMSDDLEDDDTGVKDSRPLPNFDQVKDDSKMMEIKVREYYRGNATYNMSTENKAEDVNDNSSIPLVDLHAQNALRRRIFLDRLRHILPDLLRTLGMPSRDITEDVRKLVMTFSLRADNIMFKPAEWSLIGLIIIKMLSVKDVKLKTLMETKLAQKYASMMLMAFQLDYGYLDRFMFSLCDLDKFVNKSSINI